jgi:hypothetical protein
MQIKFFNFLPCPWSPAQKLQTGFDAGIVCEASDRDALSQFLPAIFQYKFIEDHLKSDSMQWVIGLFVGHERILSIFSNKVWPVPGNLRSLMIRATVDVFPVRSTKL